MWPVAFSQCYNKLNTAAIKLTILSCLMCWCEFTHSQELIKVAYSASSFSASSSALKSNDIALKIRSPRQSEINSWNQLIQKTKQSYESTGLSDSKNTRDSLDRINEFWNR